MATGQGAIVLDFGVHPGTNEASVNVVGQSAILSTSKAEAFIMADDSTSTHTPQDHKYVGIWMNLTCGTPINAIGFTIYGRSSKKLTGQFNVRFVWAD